uniref:cellulase n=1 Tax=Leersia perrieri TaxID=77586 RepID=A0A0D9XDE6_9ORYZ
MREISVCSPVENASRAVRRARGVRGGPHRIWWTARCGDALRYVRARGARISFLAHLEKLLYTLRSALPRYLACLYALFTRANRQAQSPRSLNPHKNNKRDESQQTERCLALGETKQNKTKAERVCAVQAARRAPDGSRPIARAPPRHGATGRAMSRGRTRLQPSAAALVLLPLLLLSPVHHDVSASAAAERDEQHPPLDYREALEKSLLYFEAQRSGRLPYSQRVTWRGHSGLTDGLQQGVDLVGGYYDAGDHVKFGLPMAFTVTMLSWGAIDFSDDISSSGQWSHTLDAIKWGTDYFVKAHTHPFVYWAEVGDGDTDHYCWQRPEDMTTSRQAYKVDKENPGSDLAGETAAALAAASIVFRRTNPHYSHLLLHHAQQLFEFGDTYRGSYDSSIEEVRSYYASVSGYHDELLWAALWLHRATGKEEYLRYAVENAEPFGGVGWAMTEFSWDVKYAGLQVLAAKKS